MKGGIVRLHRIGDICGFVHEKFGRETLSLWNECLQLIFISNRLMNAFLRYLAVVSRFSLQIKNMLSIKLNAHTVGAGGLGFESQVGQIESQCRHRCDVSSELCSPGAKLRRWVTPLVSRFGVIPRV